MLAAVASSFQFRLYKPGDFAALYALEERCFQPPQRFSRRYMRQLLDCRSGAAWIALNEADKLVGFAIAEWADAGGELHAYIETLEVAAAQRRQGIGAELLHRCIASARAAGAGVLWLHVADENSAARSLYAAQGFVEQGKEPNYYGCGHDALLLALVLKASLPCGAE